ncbi:MAG: OsmC family protein [Acidobacteria bacterium]|jgi:ribosomal protein S12 methylthiotransferase accessory factor|nr:OsmC family protein [Acidobacteriota bacterium]
MNEMRIYFPGGKKVYADYKGFTHKTDQPVHAAGEGSSPSPFELFLASMGTCAGFYVLGFCQNRGIDTEGIEIIQNLEVDPETRMISKVNLEIKLPPTFPEKYKNAVIQSAGLCAVKKHMENPPQFNITTS